MKLYGFGFNTFALAQISSTVNSFLRKSSSMTAELADSNCDIGVSLLVIGSHSPTEMLELRPKGTRQPLKEQQVAAIIYSLNFFI